MGIVAGIVLGLTVGLLANMLIPGTSQQRLIFTRQIFTGLQLGTYGALMRAPERIFLPNEPPDLRSRGPRGREPARAEEILPTRGALDSAALIDSSRRQIVDEYQSGLRAIGNPIAGDPVSLEQALDNAGQILTDVANSLRAGEVRIGESYKLVSWDIGLARAADGVHPCEAMNASSMLFQTVMAAAARLLGAEPDAFQLLGMVTMALERSLTLRECAAVAGHTSFTLNQVHEAQVKERRRIARDLHDRIGHYISATHRQLELFSLYQSTDPLRAIQKMEAAQRAIEESMRNLRAVSSDLYAAETVKCLHTALMNDLEGANTEGVNLRVRVNGDESWAPPEVLDEVFLVLREAARNALRHAWPSTLIVNVDITPHEIRAFVEDDGCGFDPQQEPVSGGLGVSSMRERARLLGGTLAIRSQAGHGTHIDFFGPLHKNLHADIA